MSLKCLKLYFRARAAIKVDLIQEKIIDSVLGSNVDFEHRDFRQRYNVKLPRKQKLSNIVTVNE